MAELDPREEIVVTRWPWVLGFLLAFGLFVLLLRPILSPFVLGALIAYLGDPLVDYLERRKINRTLGVSLVFLFFSSLIAAAIFLAIPMLLAQIDALLQKIPLIYQWLVDVAAPWVRARFSVPLEQMPQIDWGDQLADNWQSLGKMSAEAIKRVTGSGASVLLGLTNLALVPVVAFYLMRDWDIIRLRLLDLAPKDWQASISEMTGEADEVVGAFLRGQFLVMLALGAIYGTGLWLVGVQLALILGLIAGTASIVPYLGFIVGILVSSIAAYAQFQDWTILLWVGLVFGVGQLLESMVLTPLLVGDRIGLHPVAVIFVLMAGGQLAGFVGVVLALPVAAVIMVFARHAVAHYRRSDIYGAGDDAG